MILKILAPFIIFAIALIQSIYSNQINKKKWLKFALIGLLISSLIVGIFVIKIDDDSAKRISKEQKNSIDSLRIENSLLGSKIDSLYNALNRGMQDRSAQEMEMEKKVNELNKKLEPFVNLALTKYPAYDMQTALNKIALDIENAKQLAKPPILNATAKEINRDKDGITLLLQFTPSKNQSLGMIEFIAELETNNSSKIVEFWPSTKGGAFSSGKDSKKISSDGKSARLIYSLISAGKPTFELKVTKSTMVRISGNYLVEPIIIEIE